MNYYSVFYSYAFIYRIPFDEDYTKVPFDIKESEDSDAI